MGIEVKPRRGPSGDLLGYAVGRPGDLNKDGEQIFHPGGKIAPDLTDLPPAHVVSAGFDPLRDEAEDYAERLRASGVPITLRRERDLVHGFINAVGLGGRAREATAEIAAAIRTGLAAATLSAAPG